MKIEVLGTGCRKCVALEAATAEALRELGMSEIVEKITDYAEIVAHGVMSTPALCLDGGVEVVGRVPTVDELKGILVRAAEGRVALAEPEQLA